MKKIVRFVGLISVFAFLTFANVNVWNDIIKKQEEQKQQEQIKKLNEDFKLERFETEEDFEKFLVEKLSDKVLQFCKKSIYPYPIPLFKGVGGISSFEKTEFLSFNNNLDLNTNQSELVDYSKTNIQKKGVDEPDVLKNNGKYLFYYNKKTNKIYILQVVSDGNIDLNKVKVIQTINVPKQIRNDVSLFATNDRLIVMATRYSNVLRSYFTDILIFDISNLPSVKLLKFYDTKGRYFDARLINNKLYVISNYDFMNLVRKICFDYRNGKIKKEDFKNFLKKGIIGRYIDFHFDKSGKFKLGGKIYPYVLQVGKANVKNILYIPTDVKDIWNLKFNVVNILDIDNAKVSPNQYIIFGNLNKGQVHMTIKSLYLVNTYNKTQSWRCPPGMYCILPIIPRGDFTLIHKLNLSGFKLNYVNSQIIPGRPINQYSMDEDSDGNFRIFTKHYYPERATDLYIFDRNLKPIGKLTNIAPGEEFKSSRFIGDKAFLVTFKATDPLFVIDLKDPTNPKIIGELKIPGYSLYLHPLYHYGDVWYLLGIGQEAKEVYGNWSLPRNIKIDLYEIDFNSYVSGNLLLNGWQQVNYKQERGSWNQKNKSYVISGNKLIIYLNKNCCNTDIKVFTDGKGTYKVLTIYTGMICRCFFPVKLIVDNVSNVKDVIFEEKDLTKENLNGPERYIKVVQLYSKVLGKEKEYKNGGSYTPVFDNPRAFVIMNVPYDVNKKIVLLPVYLAEDVKEDNCHTIYKWIEGQRKIVGEKCFSYIKKIPYFIGVKGLMIDKDEGIKEIISKNFINWYKDHFGVISVWQYKNENHRVGYFTLKRENGYKNYIFEINTNFFDIFRFDNEKEEKMVEFVW